VIERNPLGSRLFCGPARQLDLPGGAAMVEALPI
jgi:hypothetical protein